jgi:hypothetical protein
MGNPVLFGRHDSIEFINKINFVQQYSHKKCNRSPESNINYISLERNAVDP